MSSRSIRLVAAGGAAGAAESPETRPLLGVVNDDDSAPQVPSGASWTSRRRLDSVGSSRSRQASQRFDNNISNNEEVVAAFTLEDLLVQRARESSRRQAYNALFVQRPGAVGHHSMKINIKTGVQPKEHMLGVGNITWAILFGWWLALVYFVIGTLAGLTGIGIPYCRSCFSLAKYVFWPFGKYLEVIRHRTGGTIQTAASRPSLDSGAIGILGYLLWIIFFAPPLAVFHIVSGLMCWASVFFIPMAKFNLVFLKILFQSPLNVRVGHGSPPIQSEVLHCCYSAAGKRYLQYSLFGFNVVTMNVTTLALCNMIFLFLQTGEWIEENSIMVLVFCLISVIPLANLIGTAVGSISAQTSFAVGAVLNAFCGSTIELLIYFFAIKHTGPELVEKGLIGGLLVNLLMIPGVSMVVGGLKYKEQHFNKLAAGVSSMLLLVSLIGIFTPTLFQRQFGNHTLVCASCVIAPGGAQTCSHCSYEMEDLASDEIYEAQTWQLCILVAVLLPMLYVIGLVFTLKTHAHLLEDVAGEDEDADRPAAEEVSWGVPKSIIVLVVSTAIFSVVSDKLNEALGPALTRIGITPGFAGLTVIAWVPSLVEITNAVNFAWQNNISLSIEIGTSGAVQLCLIQVPALIFMQLALGELGYWEKYLFRPIFGLLDVFSVVFTVITINYISTDAKTNYFQGFVLLTMYIIIIMMGYEFSVLPLSLQNA